MLQTAGRTRHGTLLGQSTKAVEGTRSRLSTDRRWQAADQLAPAFRRASLDRNGQPVDCKRVVGGDDLVYTVRFATGVGLRTVNFVTQPGDRSSPDVVVGRTLITVPP